MDALREIARSLPPPRPELDAYLDKVRTRAYAIADADVEALQAAGLSDDEIFEQTVGVAVAEGLRRFDAGTAALA